MRALSAPAAGYRRRAPKVLAAVSFAAATLACSRVAWANQMGWESSDDDWLFAVPFAAVLTLVPIAIVAAVIGRRGAKPSRTKGIIARICLGLTILIPLPGLALVLFVAGAFDMVDVVLISILVTLALIAAPALLARRAIRRHSSAGAPPTPGG